MVEGAATPGRVCYSQALTYENISVKPAQQAWAMFPANEQRMRQRFLR
jgi:hypothetical protein